MPIMVAKIPLGTGKLGQKKRTPDFPGFLLQRDAINQVLFFSQCVQ